MEQFIAMALANFDGEAGLDFGDALLIGLGDDPVAGGRVGAWSRSGGIALDLTQTDLDDAGVGALIAREWEQFENAPESFHKEAPVGDADQLASEFIWILRDLVGLVNTALLRVWGRGPAEGAAEALGWELHLRGPTGDSEPLVARPADHEELALLVRASLRSLIGSEPKEYEPRRFLIEVSGLEVAVLASQNAFPAIRFHHRVLRASDDLRDELIAFANALHGRSSTTGSHWWLGDDNVWQVCEFWGNKFDQEIFNDQLVTFINVALERTPEIRARFGVEEDEGDLSSLAIVGRITDGPAHVDDEAEETGGAIAQVLAQAGLLVPPLGSFDIEDVEAFGRWHWGTYELSPFSLYMFEIEPVVTALVNQGPLFAMSHAGHGLNSYGLNVVATGGPFAAFVQHGFDEVCTDPLWARLRINEAYTYLHLLLEADALVDMENPRWLLLYSQFRGTCGIVDLNDVRTGKQWEAMGRSLHSVRRLRSTHPRRSCPCPR